ncbi:MAG: hypothetical protein R3D29_08015 [Nitratireductor sp.]
MPIPAPWTRCNAWAYLPDLARALCKWRKMVKPVTVSERFHFGGHNITGAELSPLRQPGLRANSGCQGSWPLIRAGGLFVPMMREISEMSYLWRVPHR